MSTRLSLILGLLVAFALGCSACSVGQAEPDTEPETENATQPVSSAWLHQGWQNQGWQNQGWQNQGWQNQGWENQGGRLRGIQIDSVTLDGQSLTNARVVAGGLVADLPVSISDPGGYLSSCSGKYYSPNCGWRAKMGRCKPGKIVKVASSGCKYCTGAVAVRACSDTTTCSTSHALVNAADKCGCVQTGFVCPAEGVFTLMWRVSSSTKISPYVTTVSVAGAVYPWTGELTPPELVGAELTAVAEAENGDEVTATVRITSVQNVASATGLSSAWHDDVTGNVSGTTYLYGLEHYMAQDDGTSMWEPACNTDPLEPGVGNLAIPVRDTWDPYTGDRIVDSSEFTFACLSGAIAKCYKWGYRPFLSPELAEAHHVCTRVARADYCGNGESHTFDGNLIAVLDISYVPYPGQIQSVDPDEPKEMEAMWGPQGAYCIWTERVDHTGTTWEDLAYMCNSDGTNAYGYPFFGCTSVRPNHGLAWDAPWINTFVPPDAPFYMLPVAEETLPASP